MNSSEKHNQDFYIKHLRKAYARLQFVISLHNADSQSKQNGKFIIEIKHAISHFTAKIAEQDKRR